MSIEIVRFSNGKRYDMGTLPGHMKTKPEEYKPLIEAGLKGKEIIEEESGLGVFPPIFEEEYEIKPFDFICLYEGEETIAILTVLGWQH